MDFTSTSRFETLSFSLFLSGKRKAPAYSSEHCFCKIHESLHFDLKGKAKVLLEERVKRIQPKNEESYIFKITRFK